MNKVIVVLFAVTGLLSPATAAELFCADQKIDMEKIFSDYDYLTALYEDNCGVEGKTCFTGRDDEAAVLIADLNREMYGAVDEVVIIGAYFKTDNSDTVLLKYKEMGVYGETVIERCR